MAKKTTQSGAKKYTRGQLRFERGALLDEQGVEIARVTYRETVGAVPDGKELVRRWNAHEELVNALRRLVTRCDGVEGVRADKSNIDTSDAHEALAKAGG